MLKSHLVLIQGWVYAHWQINRYCLLVKLKRNGWRGIFNVPSLEMGEKRASLTPLGRERALSVSAFRHWSLKSNSWIGVLQHTTVLGSYSNAKLQTLMS